MTDIDNLIGQVRNPATRSHAEEAWRCYNAGAIRASIAATWTAITADVIAKIGHLADSSDGDAKAISDAVERAQAQGLSSDGVRAMQNIEAALLDNALKVELIDDIDKRALERIRRGSQSLRPSFFAAVQRNLSTATRGSSCTPFGRTRRSVGPTAHAGPQDH